MNMSGKEEKEEYENTRIQKNDTIKENTSYRSVFSGLISDMEEVGALQH